MFPSGASKGFDRQGGEGKLNGVMCKEESLAITYELSKMRLPKERQIDYLRMLKDQVFLKEVISEDF